MSKVEVQPGYLVSEVRAVIMDRIKQISSAANQVKTLKEIAHIMDIPVAGKSLSQAKYDVMVALPNLRGDQTEELARLLIDPNIYQSKGDGMFYFAGEEA